jgi:hypothetical protein
LNSKFNLKEVLSEIERNLRIVKLFVALLIYIERDLHVANFASRFLFLLALMLPPGKPPTQWKQRCISPVSVSTYLTYDYVKPVHKSLKLQNLYQNWNYSE